MTGRARRSEYWYFVLFNSLVAAAIEIIATLLNAPRFAYLASLYALATVVPCFAVCWRRMHDIGKSGAYYLLVLIPIVGGILMLVWFCREGQQGPNEYGPDPKGGDYYSYSAAGQQAPRDKEPWEP